MNLYDIRLLNVQTQNIQASPFAPSEDGDGYEAKISVDLVPPEGDLHVGDEFHVSITMLTMVDGQDPFFTITMIGEFEIIAESAIADLKDVSAPYELGSLIYPYMRNLAKPILEYLGAEAVGFPFAPPAPPAQEKKKAPRKKRIKEE
ncbi:hypothetical protein I4N56_009685 [Pseudomonas mohnii]|uniref:hypothetical protein n=1 Tax=Pseudomonas mohnii TaxID=395600 RepID=UPI0018DB4450|nr:hypothetical protein [Pseudomonas mohnii]MBH8611183.1 hypothetical protein [Pseudomonas mohnii]